MLDSICREKLIYMYQKKASIKKFILSVVVITGIFPFSAQANSCIKKFLIFDVGSSTTKSTLYTKDLCQNITLKKEALNKNYPYQACLNHSQNNILSGHCLVGGTKILASIKDHFELCREKDQCFALATGWARTTNNIKDWSQEVEKLNIKPIIVSQDYEGHLKLQAISDHVKPEEKFLALDIGGGSFQISWFDGKAKKYNSSLGTDNFAHELYQVFLEQKDLACMKARNQVIVAKKGGGNLEKALADEEEICDQKCLVTIEEKDYQKMIIWADEKIGKPLRDNKELQDFVKKYQPTIYADSLLFTLGLKEQLELKKNQVTLEDLEKLLKTLSGQTIENINLLYPNLPDICLYSTQPSLVILYTILKNLHLKSFEIVETDYMESFLDSSIKK
jgi:hypothetical protein